MYPPVDVEALLQLENELPERMYSVGGVAVAIEDERLMRAHRHVHILPRCLT